MDIPQFLEDVATHGFTRACALHEISRNRQKEMCDYIIENSEFKITPYTTKQQIIYYFLSLQIRKIA